MGDTFQAGSMSLFLNHKSRGILIGTVDALFQTGLDQLGPVFDLYRMLIDQMVSIVLQRIDLILSEVIGAWVLFPRISFQNLV